MSVTRDVAWLATLATAVFAVVLVAWQTLLGDGVQPVLVVAGAAVFWAVFFVAYRFVRAQG